MTPDPEERDITAEETDLTEEELAAERALGIRRTITADGVERVSMPNSLFKTHGDNPLVIQAFMDILHQPRLTPEGLREEIERQKREG